MSQPDFEVTERNRVRRVPKRGIYDRESVFQILDQNLVCQVAFVMDGKPFSIPMLFARNDDELLFHGATKSRLMLMLASGSDVCMSVTMLDGLVMAKSLFHHSMNYRSVTAFGSGRELVDDAKRMEALRLITDKVMPGRWEDARAPNAKEMKATCVAAVKIDSASAKVREGAPSDDRDDLDLPIWSGVIPLRQIAEAPIADANTHSDLSTPDYMNQWLTQLNEDSAGN